MKFWRSYVLYSLLIFVLGHSLALSQAEDYEHLLSTGDLDGLYEFLKRTPDSSKAIVGYCLGILDIYQEKEYSNEEAIAYVYYKGGIHLGNINKFDSSQLFLDQAYRLSEKVYQPGHRRFYAILMHKAEKYALADQLDQAKKSIQRSLQMQWSSDRSYWRDSWYIAGSIYGKEGDHERAHVAVDIVLAAQSNIPERRVTLNLADLYLSLDEPLKALEVLKTIEAKEDADFYYYLSRTYDELGKKKEAKSAYLEELRLRTSDSLRLGFAYGNLANISVLEDQWDEALLLLEIAQSHSSSVDDKMLSLFINGSLANALDKKGQILDALQVDEAYFPHLDSAQGADFTDILEYVTGHLNRLEKILAIDPENWSSRVLEYCRYYTNFLAERRMSLDRAASSMKNGENTKHAYDLIIRILETLHRERDMDTHLDMLTAIEQNQAFLVWQERQTRQHGRVSEAGRKLSKYWALLNNANEEFEQIDLADSVAYYFLQDISVSAYANSQLEIKQKEDLHNLLEQNADEYFVHCYQFMDTSLLLLASHLGEYRARLYKKEDYFESLQVELFKIQTKMEVAPLNEDNFLNTLVTNDMPLKTDRINLIPDGILTLFPVELLLNSRDSKTVDIAHLQSLNDLTHCQSRQYCEKLVFVAPDFEVEDYTANSGLRRNVKEGMGLLRFNRAEVDKIRASLRLDSVSFFIRDIEPESLLRKIGQSDVVHFATHAFGSASSVEEPYIVLGNGGERLLFSDISDLDMNADMVVMSACETGLGEYVAGEGVLSLARAFSYAGTKSIIASLWSVDDKSSSEIMVKLYKYLNKGYRKDVALRHAKRDYVANAKGRFKRPYYWAGFIAIGDMSPLDFGSPWDGWWLWAMGGGLALFGFGCFRYFR